MNYKPPAKCLEITTGIGCRNSCTYCPQEKFLKMYSSGSPTDNRLSLENLKLCLQTVPKNIRIVFSGFCEPWLNPACMDMISYTHDSGFDVSVFTTLVGMSPEDIEKLRSIPIKSFAVHLPDDQGLTRIASDNSFEENLKKLVVNPIQNLHFLYRGYWGEKEGLHPAAKHILESHGMNWKRWDLTTRAGNLEDQTLPKKITKPLKRCPFLRRNVLLPNGDVVLCCMDWGLQHKIGNLFHSDYGSLFEGAEFRKVLDGQEDGSSNILCRTCEWASRKGKLYDAVRLGQTLARWPKRFIQSRVMGGSSSLPWE